MSAGDMTAGHIIIEQINASAAALCAELHRVSIAPSWDADAFATLLASPGVAGFIAKRADAPAGTALLRIAADEAELLTIAVAPDQRRAGVAGAMLDAVIRCAREADAIAIHLEVAADNDGARALYEGRGFSATGRRAAYYRRAAGAVDAVLLAKRLDNDEI